jgi:branched-chain amino acid transport system ATP-binding protein
MADAALATIGLRKRFGGLQATNEVNLQVRDGDFHAVIGPNGAGKSTLFNLITGFLRPDRGDILVRGRSIVGIPAHRLCHTGVSRTFQITSIFADLTVRENLMLALLSHRRRLFRIAAPDVSTDVAELLDLVALAGDMSRPAGQLSHGDQKKLELAVAVAARPRLLLLDEPTAGMASNERLEAMRAVHRIGKSLGITVLFTEHDMRVVFEVADRISVLHQGAIVAEGRPDEVRASPRVQEIYLGYADAHTNG